MSDEKRSATDQILDLLLDALQARQQERTKQEHPAAEPPAPRKADPPPEPPPVKLAPETAAPPEKTAIREHTTPVQTLPEQGSPPAEESAAVEEETAVFTAVETNDKTAEPTTVDPPLHAIQLDRMLRRLGLGLLLLIIVVNVPFNRFGASLARAMPDAQALIVRDGLVLKGSSEKIYVLENNRKRWITSLDAFEQSGYRWEQVNVVDDAFLARFPDGRPLYLLLKCQQSPHIYAIEDGQKRWIKDIATFEAEGFVWEQVQFVPCSRLSAMPDGLPIPPDAGAPPQP